MESTWLIFRYMVEGDDVVYLLRARCGLYQSNTYKQHSSFIPEQRMFYCTCLRRIQNVTRPKAYNYFEKLRCVPGCGDTVSRDRFALRTLAISSQRVYRLLVDTQYSTATSLLSQLPPEKAVAIFAMVLIVLSMSTIKSLAVPPCLVAIW